MFDWRSKLRGRWAAIAVALLLLLPGFFAPHNPMYSVAPSEHPPSLAYPFGTDMLGRDVFSRVLVGMQRTALAAAAAAALALTVGTAVAMIALASRAIVDDSIRAFLNALLAIPPLLLALVIITISGAGFLQVTVAAGLAYLAPSAFVVRAGLLELRARPYVMAARSSGAAPMRLWLVHILPNITPLIASYGVVIFAYCILSNAALQFLGLAGEPGVPDLGAMMSEGRFDMRAAPWAVLAPGMALTMMILLVNAAAGRAGRSPA
ncbi:MAG: ABC transporter permease [Anaerolineae bacterium]|nr:ABC transporter permease [Anaerolineae bacterium]